MTLFTLIFFRGHFRVVKLTEKVIGEGTVKDTSATDFIKQRLYSRRTPRLPAHLVVRSSSSALCGAKATKQQIRNARFHAALKHPLSVTASGFSKPSSSRPPRR